MDRGPTTRRTANNCRRRMALACERQACYRSRWLTVSMSSCFGASRGVSAAADCAESRQAQRPFRGESSRPSRVRHADTAARRRCGTGQRVPALVVAHRRPSRQHLVAADALRGKRSPASSSSPRSRASSGTHRPDILLGERGDRVLSLPDPGRPRPARRRDDGPQEGRRDRQHSNQI